MRHASVKIKTQDRDMSGAVSVSDTQPDKRACQVFRDQVDANDLEGNPAGKAAHCMCFCVCVCADLFVCAFCGACQVWRLWIPVEDYAVKGTFQATATKQTKLFF